ncbi:MAG TPA: tetratricopeptide repeat protein, partial [Polyangia bacterium]
KLFQGNTADAIVEFNEAHRLNPKDPAVHRGLGLAYAQSGKSAEAVKQLKLYLKAFPKAPDRTIIEKRIDQLHGK